MPFPNSVRITQAPGVAGDFASTNPRHSALSVEGGFVAGPAGVTVAAFAWVVPDSNGNLRVLNSFGSGDPAGFVHRNLEALITVYLSETSMIIPPGMGIGDLFDGGDFWVLNSGTTQVLTGMAAYANYSTGLASFAAAGSVPSGTVTGSIAAGTASATGTITGDLMTITGAVTGTIYPGAITSGANVASGTQVVEQISGTTGGDGVYAVSIPGQAVASTTISFTYGTLTVTAVTAPAVLEVGSPLSGSGVAAGTTVTALGTGTGGIGTYIVSPTGTTASTTITLGEAIQTKFIAATSGAPGELIKMTSSAAV